MGVGLRRRDLLKYAGAIAAGAAFEPLLPTAFGQTTSPPPLAALPTRSMPLFTMLPLETRAQPFGRPLLDQLDGGAAFDAPCTEIARRFQSPLADRGYQVTYRDIRDTYDRATRAPGGKTSVAFDLRPREPWEGITPDDVRNCFVAAALLLARTHAYLPPAALMALWVIEGKVVRNKFYRGGELRDVKVPAPGAKKEAIVADVTSLAILNGSLEAVHAGTWGKESIPNNVVTAIREAYPMLTGPNPRLPDYAFVDSDKDRAWWWAWSHTLPHLWSLDIAVARYPTEDPAGLHLPPTAGGKNIRGRFHEWLGRFKAVRALDEKDPPVIVRYCSRQGKAFRVRSDTTSRSWPIRISSSETNRVVTLFLFLTGARFLDQGRLITTAFQLRDQSDVPLAPMYAAFNSRSGVARVKSRYGHVPKADLAKQWRRPALDAEERRQFRGSRLFNAWVNALRFLYVYEVLEPLTWVNQPPAMPPERLR